MSDHFRFWAGVQVGLAANSAKTVANLPRLLAGLTQGAHKLGLRGSRLLLVILIFLAFVLMTVGVRPLWCIVFIVVPYLMDRLSKIASLLLANRLLNKELRLKRADFDSFLESQGRNVQGLSPSVKSPESVQ